MAGTFSRLSTKWIGGATAAVFLLTAAGHRPARAMIAPADRSAAVGQAADAHHTQRMREALERRLLQQRLMDLGLTQEEAAARLKRLSAEQVHQAAAQADQQAPGGDTTGIILVAVGVALFVVIIAKILSMGDEDDDADDDNDTNVQQQGGPPAERAPGTIIVK